MIDGVNQTYSASDATNFDALFVADGAEGVFNYPSFTTPQRKLSCATTFYTAGTPLDILVDAFPFDKPVGAVGMGLDSLHSDTL